MNFQESLEISVTKPMLAAVNFKESWECQLPSRCCLFVNLKASLAISVTKPMLPVVNFKGSLGMSVT